MTQRQMHANLLSAQFPFKVTELSSTVVLNRGFEQNRIAQSSFEGEGAEQSDGISQAYFMQNVMPITRGYTSLNFARMIQDVPAGATIDSCHVLRQGDFVALYIPGNGENWVFDPYFGSWVSFPDPQTASTPQVFFLKGETYIFFPEYALWRYDFVAKDFSPVTLVGLDPSNIVGMISAGSRAIGWSGNQIYWGGEVDTFDFTPSLADGAGTSSVLAIRSTIVACIPLLDSFVIYTAYNAVAAQGTGNIQFPWAFSEIPGVIGIADADHVAWAYGLDAHTVLTPSGLQIVTLRQSQSVWAELADSLRRGVFSVIDPTTNYPTFQYAQKLDVRLRVIGGRWITVSIRTGEDKEDSLPFRFAYIFDTMLQRWGRMDALHMDVLHFSSPDFALSKTYAELAVEFPTYEDLELADEPYSYFQDHRSVPAPELGKNFAVLSPVGGVFRAAPNETDEGFEEPFGLVYEQPRILLGRFKLFREHGMILQWIKLYNLDSTTAEILAHSHDYTGRLVRSVADFAQNRHHIGQYFRRLSGDSVSIELRGKFTLVDLTLCSSGAGTRKQAAPSPEPIIYQVVNYGAPVTHEGDPVIHAEEY